MSLIEGLRRIDRESFSYSAYLAAANILSAMNAADSQLPQLKVAVLRNFTLEPLMAVLKAEIARIGFYPDIYMGGHDTIATDVLSADSPFYQFEADCIILAQWLDELSPKLTRRFVSLSADQITGECRQVLETISRQLSGIRRYSKAPILFNNFPFPYPPAFGILETQCEHLQINTILRMNQELYRLVKEFKNVFIIDYAYLMSTIGYQNAFDARYWYTAKAPISRHALLPFGKEYARFIRALFGKTSKCLILDCDNTLWGGVIGEDGLNGIALGPGYPGLAYQSFQEEILNLHDKGIILALCSKNNEADVEEVFQKHPYMQLKKHHFATWRINWKDKASNIRDIVAELNIGMDSVVFADDSAYEIGLVKYQIPQIAVFELPADPSQLRIELGRGNYFDTLTFSDEDKRRNQMYRDEVVRRELATQCDSVEDYLKQLEMCAQIDIPDDLHVPRVAQLTQKTNQFNLTARRYTPDEIKELVTGSTSDVWCVKLKDKISDMGIIGVAVVRYQDKAAMIDNLLLSCRALGRGVEDAFMSFIVEQTKEKGLSTLRGEYKKTAKNGQTASFYERQGFRRLAGDDQSSQWELSLKQWGRTFPSWINLEGGGA